MEYRQLGKTSLRISEIGFGCGNVGGLMIRGERADRLKAVAQAMELGINYFDTASMYGNGVSEQNLGQALNELRAQVHVGTKVRLRSDELDDIKTGIARSVEQSLQRLGRDSVDLIQLHNAITLDRNPQTASMSVEDVLGEVVGAFQELKIQGKTHHYGITGVGDTAALHQVIDAGWMESVQTPYNLINPSAGFDVSPGSRPQDFGAMIDRASGREMGVIVIRVLAGGALGGVPERHPIASPPPTPIGSNPTYEEDFQRAGSMDFLVTEGHAGSLPEAAVRFALAKLQVSTVLVGYSSLEQLEHSVAYASRGPLAAEALERLSQEWRSLT